MQLGAFSVSLPVKDLDASCDFYTRLGFEQVGGDFAQNYLIMRNGQATIGLFQGMFDTTLLTFNPGWAQDMSPLDQFDTVRTIQQNLRDAGIEPYLETAPDGTGPGHIVVTDPDGNQILIDQHV